MRFGRREPRSSDARRRTAFRPLGEALDRRQLLASLIDLGGVPPGPGTDTTPTRSTPLPNITGSTLSPVPNKAYGVDMAGTLSNQSAGYSVADVGDVNGDGYDDFAIGAPAVASPGGSAGANQATVYLVFGSLTTTNNTISNWLNNNDIGRVGNLSQLGNSAANQTNPINGLSGYPFAGIKFITSQTPGSELGESVSAAVGVNRQRGFMIGAPGPRDPVTTTTGSGRAFLISGGTNLNALIGQTIDLDNVANAGLSGVNVTTFVSSNPLARTGQSVAGVGDVITNGNPDIAIGAPNATINGLANAGAVYVIDGLSIPSGVTTVNLDLVGQGGTGSVAGMIFAGGVAGAQAGWSVAPAFNVNGDVSSANQSADDLLIGAPAIASGAPGTAYLVYGSVNLASYALTNGGLLFVNLSRIGSTSTTTPVGVPGMSVTGATGGDRTGYSVSSAGDFNGDTFADVLIGSPGATNDTGRVDIFYGASNSSTHFLTGQLTLSVIPSAIVNATLTGANLGDLAGFSVSQVGRINATANNPGNPIIIGAPGFSSNAGTAYLLPSNPNTLTGVNSLATATASPLQATQFVFTVPGSTTAPRFGTSVSGRLIQSGQSFTADSDLVADLIIGAPGYQALTIGANRAGGGLILEGALVPLDTIAPINPPPPPPPPPSGGGSTNLATGLPIGTVIPSQFIPPYGPDRFTPQLSELSRLMSYKPLPYRVAVNQYMPDKAFAQRLINYYYPSQAKNLNHVSSGTAAHSGRRTSTLGTHVFTRGKWHAGDVKNFTHNSHVIPTNLQTERLGGQAKAWYALTAAQRKAYYKTPRFGK